MKRVNWLGSAIFNAAGENLTCLAFWNAEKAWDWVFVASNPKATLYVVAFLNLPLDMAGKMVLEGR
jgi:hypothetical protein